MPLYRVYPLDTAGRIMAPFDVEGGDDGEAIRFAQALGHGVRHGCEVWQLTRFIGRFHFEGVRPVASLGAAAGASRAAEAV